MCNKISTGDIVEITNKEFRLVEKIGEGGSGYVWRAECDDDNKYVIKFLKKKDKNKEARFKEEIKFCKDSIHENIIKVFGDTIFKGQYCYVMPYYSKTLRFIIDDNSIAYDQTLKHIEKLCEAIKYIHEKKVIHRDIKPENILIEGDKLVLADFGIAHFKDSTLTKTGDLLANRNYLAPEQRINQNATEITNAADIYALGAIINECFTKQNPSGTQFNNISDVYPILGSLDKLVYSMMKQNPNERPKINEVVLELKLQMGVVDDLLEVVKENIEPHFDIGISKDLLERILNRACEDILTAKYIFENKSDSEIEKYNHNYHMNIIYDVDEFIINLYFQELLYKLCKNKFRYESNVYKNGHKYSPLDLENNKEHINLYEKLQEILNHHPNRDHDLSGEILKLYTSCCENHCKEILNYVEGNNENSIDYQIKALSNSPILYIIKSLKEGIIKNRGMINTLKIEDHILINWIRSKSFEGNSNDMNLFKSESYKQEKKIFSCFQNKWDIVIGKVDTSYYSVKFNSYTEYSRFRDFALELSKPYYIFEGDVLDLIRIEREYNGIVELKPLDSFDIEDTLSKILGLRSDY